MAIAMANSVISFRAGYAVEQRQQEEWWRRGLEEQRWMEHEAQERWLHDQEARHNGSWRW
jgi:hypothetical protein